LTFAPATNALGTATVTVTVNNGGTSNNLVSQQFTVTVLPIPVVSQPPTLNAITNLTFYENAGLQTVALTGISPGSGGNPTVTVSTVSSATTIIPAPTVYYTNSNSSGILTFAPATNALGTATVTVTVNNGGTSNNLVSQQFTVTVLPIPVVSQPPTLNAITNLTIYENAGLQTVALTGISPGSGGNPTVTVSAVSSATTIIPTPTVYYTNSNSSGILTFAPATNASGTATVTVTVNNGGKTNNLVSQQFTVTVLPVPTLNTISNLTIFENAGTQTVALTGIASGSTNGNLTLQVSAHTSNSTIIPTPTVNYTSPNSTGNLAFAPAAGALGTATLTVTVNNGPASFSQVFTVTVAPPPAPQPPTLNAITNLTIYESSKPIRVVLTNITTGSAAQTGPLTVTAVSSTPAIIPTPAVTYTNPDNFGTLTLAPPTNTLGTSTITVTVNNGDASNNILTRTFTVTVVVPPGGNEPPTLNPVANLSVVQGTESESITLTGISSGSPSQKQTLKVTATSSKLTIVPTPSIRYTSPASNAVLTIIPSLTNFGAATITVTVNNGGKSNNIIQQTFTVTIVTNTPPTLNPIANVTVLKNAASQTVNLTGITSGSPAENQVLTVTVASSNTGLIPTPAILYTSPETNASLTFKPAPNLTGTAILTVTVNDGGGNNNLFHQSFSVTVTTNLTSNAASGLNTTAALKTMVTAGAGFSFQVTGVTGGKYVVEATSDWKTWSPLQTNTAPFTFLDSATNAFSQRFYRASYLTNN
jgi:hypothetical protein